MKFLCHLLYAGKVGFVNTFLKIKRKDLAEVAAQKKIACLLVQKTVIIRTIKQNQSVTSSAHFIGGGYMGFMAQFFNKRFGMGVIPILYGRADCGLYQPFYLLASSVPAPCP